MRPPAKALPVLAVLLTAALSGCVGGDPDGTAPAAGADVPPVASHVLAGATEPADLTAPAFELLGALAATGPGYGGGEPSIWAHLDGTVFVAFPGCDAGPYLVEAPGADTCDHGLVYKSTDGGASWTRLNREGDGRLEGEGPAANGDADVAVDAAGVVYTSNLGSGIQVHRSDDGGTTWLHVADVVPEDHWADRQWMAAGKPGHLIMAWMGGAEGGDRQVAVNVTRDGGATWNGVQYVGNDIGWLGTVQMDVSGERAFIPFTEVESGAGDPVLGLYGAKTFKVLVARTLDGGDSWDVVDTGARVTTTASGGHWSGVLMAPALDVTGGGHVVAAWAEDVPDPTGTTSMGAVVKLVSSPDWGASWSAPVTVGSRTTSIMPWVTAGAGDRVALTYLSTDSPLDSDYAGSTWDVMSAVVDGVGSASPTVVESVVEAGVHQGGACTRGGLCLLTGSDRALLDFFESDLMPDGRLVVTYPADPLQGGKYIEIRTAIQDGGSLLLVPPTGDK